MKDMKGILQPVYIASWRDGDKRSEKRIFESQLAENLRVLNSEAIIKHIQDEIKKTGVRDPFVYQDYDRIPDSSPLKRFIKVFGTIDGEDECLSKTFLDELPPQLEVLGERSISEIMRWHTAEIERFRGRELTRTWYTFGYDAQETKA